MMSETKLESEPELADLDVYDYFFILRCVEHKCGKQFAVRLSFVPADDEWPVYATKCYHCGEDGWKDVLKTEKLEK